MLRPNLIGKCGGELNLKEGCVVDAGYLFHNIHRANFLLLRVFQFRKNSSNMIERLLAAGIGENVV